jgi:DNA-binding transcriptional ArsR family regulator
LWTDLNRPPFSDFRESERLVRPEERTLLWLLEPKNTAETNVGAGSGTTGGHPPVGSRAIELLTGADFVDWRDSQESRCLLVTAPPGSGKSVFSNFVIGHLEECTTKKKSEKVIYYFCNIRVPISERSAEAVVRALIVQLCQDESDLIAQLPPRFEKDSNAFLYAPLSDLWGILSFMMQRNPFSHVYCVIDGLDVYGESMVQLVQKLLSLFGISESGAPRLRKLLCTSRPDSRIMGAWEGHFDRQLRPNESDLRAYIESRCSSLKDFDQRMREAARSALLKDLEDSLRVDRVGPTFLWISMAVRKLESIPLPSIKEIGAEIENTSRDLDKLFEGLIVTACDRAGKNALILAWVMYVEQPLTLEELRDATAIDPSRDYASYDQLEDTRPMLTGPNIRGELGTLLDILDGRLFVIHQSVQDFVKKKRILERWILPEPRLFLADCCLRYLLMCLAENQTGVSHHDKANVSPDCECDWYVL